MVGRTRECLSAVSCHGDSYAWEIKAAATGRTREKERKNRGLADTVCPKYEENALAWRYTCPR